MGLAADWEAVGLIRNRARQNGALTVWPDTKSQGVASMKACAMNSDLLKVTAQWWVQYCDQPASIPIDLIRAEVRVESKNVETF